MTDAALVFDKVSKIYDIGRVQGSIGESLQANSRRARRERVQRKALDDVSFTVTQGEAFAMIGDNGAGKTTALKVATRLVHPTSGTVRVRGRVGALIEVGTGLHPDLTGRENLSLFGRILGIPRNELSRSFDAIVDFAEIGEAIDQPIKQYSSGMQLRLGFAIAAHLEPDVLIVDEAIAVGDVGFQRKCIDRMAQLVRDGRTLIFVSHDLMAIEMLCRRAIHLDHGRIVADGPAADVVDAYLASVDARRGELAQATGTTGGPVQIERITVHTPGLDEVGSVPSGGTVTLRIHYRSRDRLLEPVFSVGITEGGHNPLFLASMAIDGQAPAAVDGAGYLDCIVEELPLTPNTYDIWLSVLTSDGAALVEWQRIRRLVVVGERPGSGMAAVSLGRMAPLLLPYRWTAPVEEAGDAGSLTTDPPIAHAPASESRARDPEQTEQRPA